jgi:cytochrome c oxidase assembly protein subunit 15
MATVFTGALASASSRAAASKPGASPAVAAWLLVCCALVFAMVVVGGITRLTHAGLSITEWQPIVGTVPPLSASDWDEAFAKYRATPEYRQVNAGMSLAAFKRIFWWEYAHRLLGRAIGVVFLVPFLWFLLRGRLPRGYAGPLALIFLLGGAQGALGWYMVASGLVDDPRVSQFRLTAHLGLAFLIFGAMLWTAWSLRAPRAPVSRDRERRAVGRWTLAFVALVFTMVLTGGLVAGLRAGFAYNTFPLMQGHFIPPEVLMLDPVWKNFFWNMATVQLDHRLIAWTLAVVTPLLWWRIERTTDMPRRARIGARLLVAMVAVQIALGIATLVNVVPLPLAAAHQAGALIVFGLALNLLHAVSRAVANPASNGDDASRLTRTTGNDHG